MDEDEEIFQISSDDDRDGDAFIGFRRYVPLQNGTFDSAIREDMGNLALISQGSQDGQPNEAVDQDAPQSFNEDLPACHSYLGENLEEVSGRSIFSELSYVTIPLLSGSYGTVLPGMTFPLTVRDYTRVAMLRRCVEGDHTFGCIATRYQTEDTPDQVMFGCTAEIYEFSYFNGQVCIKARGRQRFRVIKTKRCDTSYKLAEVLILPEITLQHPFTALHLSSFNSLRVSNKERCRRIESQLMHWPNWVYDMYDSSKLVKRADKLTILKQGIRKDKGPIIISKDPTKLSFWIASQLDSEKRLFMLTLNSPIPRLRWLMSFLSRFHQFICRSCEVLIGKQNDVFAMSTEGAQSTYVNSEGYHHDTITLLEADNVIPISAPSTHYSWFPGYAWSITVCRNCQKHVGWQFTATNTRLQPFKFWGLTRHSLDTRICTDKNICTPEDMPVM